MEELSVYSVMGQLRQKRIVTVKYLDPVKTYQVKSMNGKVVATLTGHDLHMNGFSLTLEGLYSGDLLEVSVK